MDGSASAKFPSAAYNRRLGERLGNLPPRQRAAVAAACAERLYTSYAEDRDRAGMDDEGLIRSVLDLAWQGAIQGRVDHPDTTALVERCVALIPDADSDEAIADYVDDAIAAAAYALQAAAGLSDSAARWSAERGIDALDSFVLTAIGWTGGTADEADAVDQLVWAHPLMRQEVARRETDLAQILEPDVESAVRAVRLRATGASLFDLEP